MLTLAQHYQIVLIVLAEEAYSRHIGLKLASQVVKHVLGRLAALLHMRQQRDAEVQTVGREDERGKGKRGLCALVIVLLDDRDSKALVMR